MSDREPTQRPGGRSGMSVSGTLSIIVAAVAVILGFLILRDINDAGDASGNGDGTTETTATVPGGPDNTDTPTDGSTTAPTTPTLKPYTVIVANAAGVGGAAAAMTTALQGISVQTLPGINSNVTDQPTTTIYYIAGYEFEAQDLATKMGVATPPAPMPDPAPIASDASLGAANLLVQLGSDLAGKPLPAAGASTAPPAT
jgi:LytR cell envelope-related transcriptional attenuator